ncbi:MAG TPA: hypothetical protein VGB19_11440 [Actinomycetota bacterium]
MSRGASRGGGDDGRADGDGTALTQWGTVEPNLVGRLMAPLIRSKMRSRLRRLPVDLGAYLASRRGASA